LLIGQYCIKPKKQRYQQEIKLQVNEYP
jgi:hypothetical protein